MHRVGIGYDIHPFEDGTPLILGGVKIPHPLGLKGHSDADVVSHAVADALLGAANLGDIGEHFPDTDDKNKNISSLKILKDIFSLISDKGWQLENIDVSIIAEEPKIGPYKEQMAENICEALSCNASDISIKATTNERLGALGRGEGIAAMAVALLSSAK